MLSFAISAPVHLSTTRTQRAASSHRRRIARRAPCGVPRMCIEAAASRGAVEIPRAPDDLVAAAHAAADAAREVIRGYFRGGTLATRLKADESPVTAADVAAEAAMREVLEQHTPGVAVLGEETGGSVAQLAMAEWAWVLDPIDGTKAFLSGRPTFGTLVALLHRGAPVYGVIDQPVARERWTGGVGRPASLCGEAIGVRRAAPMLADALVHATTPEMFAGSDAERFQAVRHASRGAVYGEDCYAYAMLASGFVDLVVEADLKVWDFMALVPIVEAAGGVMRDWDGRALDPASDGRVVAAASTELLNETLDVISSVEVGSDTPR